MQSDLKTLVEPIYWDEVAHGYVVTGFEEAGAILRNSSAWSSNPSNAAGASIDIGLPPRLLQTVVLMDPPDHARLRSQLSPAFSPRVIEQLRPRVRSIVNAVLDGLEDEDEADIVADVGRVVPPAVIAELLDVGTEGAEVLLEQAPRLVRWMERHPEPEDIQMTMDAAEALRCFLTPIMEERKRKPGDDFISALVTVVGLSFDEVLTTCYVILAAGGEATGRLIGNATLAILRDPVQIPHLLADPGRAVEELLRMEGTSKQLIRISAVEQEIAGHRIGKGQFIYIDVLAANRDPRRGPGADRMELSREPLGHLTMGVGPHFCLGAGMGRLQATETLSGLFGRFPDMSLINPDPVWNPSTTFRGLRELPVRLRGTTTDSAA